MWRLVVGGIILARALYFRKFKYKFKILSFYIKTTLRTCRLVLVAMPGEETKIQPANVLPPSID